MGFQTAHASCVACSALSTSPSTGCRASRRSSARRGVGNAGAGGWQRCLVGSAQRGHGGDVQGEQQRHGGCRDQRERELADRRTGRGDVDQRESGEGAEGQGVHKIGHAERVEPQGGGSAGGIPVLSSPGRLLAPPRPRIRNIRGDQGAASMGQMTSVPGSAPVRQATLADVDAITAAFTTAFFHDPVWGPAFPDERRRARQAAVLWRVYAVSALRYPWTFVTPYVEAAAIWIPPGGTELTPDEACGLGELMEKAAGPEVAASVQEIEARFEAAHPAEPFFHLTLLATHARHRGKGLGMGLL